MERIGGLGSSIQEIKRETVLGKGRTPPAEGKGLLLVIVSLNEVIHQERTSYEKHRNNTRRGIDHHLAWFGAKRWGDLLGEWH